jgi:hypothetical protein
MLNHTSKVSEFIRTLMEHGVGILTSAALWHGYVKFLQKNRLPHEIFPLTHHITITAASWLSMWYYYTHRTPEEAVIVPASAGGEAVSSSIRFGSAWMMYLSSLVPVHIARGDKSPAFLAYTFLGYLITDTVNRKHLKRPFTTSIWVHHSAAFIYVLVSCITMPEAMDGAIVGIQETSTIFLTLMELGVKHVGVQALFLLTFVGTRLGVGGLVAFDRARMYLSGKFPSGFVAGMWSVQLAINLFFFKLILLKLMRSSKPRKA